MPHVVFTKGCCFLRKRELGTTQWWCMLFWRNLRSNTLQNSICTAAYFQSLELSKKDELGTAREGQTHNDVSYGFHHMGTPVLSDQQKLTLSALYRHWMLFRGLAYIKLALFSRVLLFCFSSLYVISSYGYSKKIGYN